LNVAPFGNRPPAARQASIEPNGVKFFVRSYQLLAGEWQMPLLDCLMVKSACREKLVVDMINNRNIAVLMGLIASFTNRHLQMR
jgi:hypothetical protein